MSEKTCGGWRTSDKVLTEYLQPGDTVDEAMVQYFVEVLPPVTMRGHLVQMGEPHSHDAEGFPLYLTLERKGWGWTYIGPQRRRTA